MFHLGKYPGNQLKSFKLQAMFSKQLSLNCTNLAKLKFKITFKISSV